jgi:CheY-like chemotaxis protein
VSPVHVLVVDDETLVREVIAEYLKADGHTVDVAANGQDGLEKFEKGNFDLVLVDRAMPGMNGDQVAAGIKSANPKVPVIMLTGFGAMMLAADEKPAGVDFVVGKPVTINDLRDVLAKAVHLAH